MLTDPEAQLLLECARALGAPSRVVATGHGAAEASRVMTAAATPGVEFVTVEPDELARVDGPIDVLFVGSTGRYSTAIDALERWGGRVIPAGTMFVYGAFAAPALTAALLRSVGSSPSWRYFGREGALAEYTRADLARGERALDAVAQVAQLPGFARATLRRRLARGASVAPPGG